MCLRPDCFLARYTKLSGYQTHAKHVNVCKWLTQFVNPNTSEQGAALP